MTTLIQGIVMAALVAGYVKLALYYSRNKARWVAEHIEENKQLALRHIRAAEARRKWYEARERAYKERQLQEMLASGVVVYAETDYRTGKVKWIRIRNSEAFTELAPNL